MARKFQIITTTVSEAGQIVPIEADIDKNAKLVERISIFTDPDFYNNQNLEVFEPLTIDDKEVYPRKFKTPLLHPSFQDNYYSKVGMAIEGKSKLRVSLKDLSEEVSEPYTVEILLVLSDC